MKKIILVTGASSGIGKDSALQLIKEGHVVYGAARRLDRMEKIVSAGGYAIKMDITNTSDIEATINQIIAEQGRIDVLFNNAGYAVWGAIETVSMEDAKQQFDVNLFGLAEITKAVLPHMRSKKSGTIINTSSMAGRVYTPLGAWYHASKHALEGWSDCLRLEVKHFGIDVVVIQPGGITTEFGAVMVDPMISRSKGTPYEKITNLVAKATQAMYGKPGALSSTVVITKLVSKAVRSDKPKTRYVAGKYAKPMMFIRKYFGDRIFDKVVMSTARNV